MAAKIRNPLLASIAALTTLALGSSAGMIVGSNVTKIPKHLRPIEAAKFENTDTAPHGTVWKQYPQYQEAVTVLDL